MPVLLRALPVLVLLVLAASFWLWERATPPADAAPTERSAAQQVSAPAPQGPAGAPAPQAMGVGDGLAHMGLARHLPPSTL